MRHKLESIRSVFTAVGAFARRLRRNERGNILIETALVMPIFASLAMGAFDIGRFAMENARMEQASRAGAQLALLDLADLPTIADVEAAVVTAATLAIGPAIATLNVDAVITCWCAVGTVTTDVTCDTLCGSGDVAGTRLVVTANHSMDPVFTIPGFLETRTVNSKTVIMF